MAAGFNLRFAPPTRRPDILTRIFYHESGRAELERRRYKVFLNIPMSRAPAASSLKLRGGGG